MRIKRIVQLLLLTMFILISGSKRNRKNIATAPLFKTMHLCKRLYHIAWLDSRKNYGNGLFVNRVHNLLEYNQYRTKTFEGKVLGLSFAGTRHWRPSDSRNWWRLQGRPSWNYTRKAYFLQFNIAVNLTTVSEGSRGFYGTLHSSIFHLKVEETWTPTSAGNYARKCGSQYEQL